MSCPQDGGCAYFEQAHMQQLEGLSSLFRSRYCDGDHERCARHRVGEVFGPTGVPADLRPNDHTAATEMLAPTAASVG
jgi:hypothetical protein